MIHIHNVYLQGIPFILKTFVGQFHPLPVAQGWSHTIVKEDYRAFTVHLTTATEETISIRFKSSLSGSTTSNTALGHFRPDLDYRLLGYAFHAGIKN